MRALEEKSRVTQGVSDLGHPRLSKRGPSWVVWPGSLSSVSQIAVSHSWQCLLEVDGFAMEATKASCQALTLQSKSLMPGTVLPGTPEADTADLPLQAGAHLIDRWVETWCFRALLPK